MNKYTIHPFFILFGLILCLLAGTIPAEASALTSSCRIIVGLGHNINRFYLFQDFSYGNTGGGLNGGHQMLGNFEFFDSFPSISPGLSSQKRTQAYTFLKPGFQRLNDFLKQNQGASIPLEPSSCQVHLLGSSGIRELSQSKQDDLYDHLYVDAKSDPMFTFQLNRDHLRTISSEEEGYFLIIGGNYLDGRLEGSLKPGNHELFGALEMTSDRMTLAFDIQERWRRSTRRKQLSKPINASDFFIKQYQGLGFQQFHLDFMTNFLLANTTHSLVETPCLEKETKLKWKELKTELMVEEGQEQDQEEDSKDNLQVVGKGDGKKCIDLIDDFLSIENAACPEGSFCAFKSESQPHLFGHFFAIEGFYTPVQYASQFLQEFSTASNRPAPPYTLDMPTPSLTQLAQASNYICSNLSKAPKKAKMTCFELSLVVVVLRHLGFGEEDKSITFLSEIENQKISWPIGAFMYFEAEERRLNFQLETDLLAIQVSEGLPVGWHLSILVFLSACFYLYIGVYPHSEKHWIVQIFGKNLSHQTTTGRRGINNKSTKSIQFIDDASE